MRDPPQGGSSRDRNDKRQRRAPSILMPHRLPSWWRRCDHPQDFCFATMPELFFSSHHRHHRRCRCGWALLIVSPLMFMLLFWMRMDLYRSSDGVTSSWKNKNSIPSWQSSSSETTTTTTGATTIILPNVLIAGAQKAGTTAVAKHLLEGGRRLWDACGPDPQLSKIRSSKEAHFLDQDDAVQRGAAAYGRVFAHCSGNHNSILGRRRRRRPRRRLVLDATPGYEVYPERVRAVYEQLGPGGPADSVKIIFILREPVSRELSWHHHLVTEASRRDGHRPPAAWATRHVTRRDPATNATVLKTFAERLRDEILPSIRGPNNVTNRGLYAHWLQRWVDAGFDRRTQILVLAYDELRQQPGRSHQRAFLQRLHQFLELPPPRAREALPWRNRQQQHHRHRNGNNNNNNNKEEVESPGHPSCALQEQLARAYDAANQELYQWLRDHPGPEMEQRPFPEFDFRCREA